MIPGKSLPLRGSLALRQPTRMPASLGGRSSRYLTQPNSFELSHDSIQLLACELAPAQCRTEVGPVKELRAREGERRGDARFHEHLLNVRPSPAIYVANNSGGLCVLVSPAAHADFKQTAVPESAVQQHIDALFGRVMLCEIRDNRFCRRLSPMPNHLGMKGAEITEVPIKAAARDTKLARKDIRLESLKALPDQRFQAEIDPVLCCQVLGHYAAPYSTVLTVTTGER